MDNELEQELYEEPDYNVWETARVYEDMDLERADREAEALEAEVQTVVEGVMDGLPGMPLDIIERIAYRILVYQRDERQRQQREDEENLDRHLAEAR